MINRPVGDNCPNFPNPTQADTGGLLSASADGIGDACQCGDANADGMIDLQDVGFIRALLAFGTASIAPEELDHCTALSTTGACDLIEVALVRRALEGLTPPLAQACSRATPN